MQSTPSEWQGTLVADATTENGTTDLQGKVEHPGNSALVGSRSGGNNDEVGRDVYGTDSGNIENHPGKGVPPRVEYEGTDSQSDEEDRGVDRTVAVGLELEGQEIGAGLADGIRVHSKHEREVKGGRAEKMRCNNTVGGSTLVEYEQAEWDP
ncbi:unnamed protein product [Aspergillus oryzae]|nr:unnamed protein product [Aspergillus oryzae]